MSVLALFLARAPLSVLGCSARSARARWEPVCACAAPRPVLLHTGTRRRHVTRARLEAQDPKQPVGARLEFSLSRDRHLVLRKLLGTPLPCCLSRQALHLSPGKPSQDRTRPKYGSPETEGTPGHSEQAKRRLSELYENPWTIPNLLSMTRIGLAPVLGYLIVGENFNFALGVFVLAGVTDLLDGFIARNWANQKSALGSALDPLADKILISVLYICLTYAHLIPVPLTIMIILRDIALIAAVFYVRYKTLPPPRTVSKYFNPCYVTAHLEPTFISKMNTAVQLILVAASLAAPVFNYVDSVYLQTLWCITAFTTAASAYSYYHYGQQSIKILNNK